MNQTVGDAVSVRGRNPQHLVDQILRLKVYNCHYWKERCFGLTVATLLDRAVELRSMGGIYGGGGGKVTDFLCLVVKLLQLQPEMEIIDQFLRNEEFKYVRALGAVYLRLVGSAREVYCKLEPLLNDYSKLCMRLSSGQWTIVHMDQLVDDLLREEAVCSITLPHMMSRRNLERSGALRGPRVSVLQEEALRVYERRQAEEVAREREQDQQKEEEKKADGDGSLSSTGLTAVARGIEASRKRERVAQSGGTVAYWNAIRAEIGLRPLYAPTK